MQAAAGVASASGGEHRRRPFPCVKYLVSSFRAVLPHYHALQVATHPAGILSQKASAQLICTSPSGPVVSQLQGRKRLTEILSKAVEDDEGRRPVGGGSPPQVSSPAAARALSGSLRASTRPRWQRWLVAEESCRDTDSSSPGARAQGPRRGSPRDQGDRRASAHVCTVRRWQNSEKPRAKVSGNYPAFPPVNLNTLHKP